MLWELSLKKKSHVVNRVAPKLLTVTLLHWAAVSFGYPALSFHDEAQLFSKSARKELARELENFPPVLNKIRLETSRSNLGKVTDSKLTEEISQWARQKKIGADELWIYIHRDPNFLFVAPGESLRATGAFRNLDREVMVRKMADGFSRGNAESAIQEGLRFLKSRLVKMTKPPEPEVLPLDPNQIFGIWVSGLLLIVLIFLGARYLVGCRLGLGRLFFTVVRHTRQ